MTKINQDVLGRVSGSDRNMVRHWRATLKNGRYTNPKKLAFKVLAGAYASHLILDGDTPKGLPLL